MPRARRGSPVTSGMPPTVGGVGRRRGGGTRHSGTWRDAAGSAWEIAARYSAYTYEDDLADYGAWEAAGAVNYYIDGHADKVTLDVAWIGAEDDGNYLWDYVNVYPAYWSTGDSDGLLVRLQWQLAL